MISGGIGKRGNELLQGKYLDIVIDEIQKAKEVILALVVKPVPDELKKLLDSYSQRSSLTEEDINIITGVGFNSFLGMKEIEKRFKLFNNCSEQYDRIMLNLDYLKGLIQDELPSKDVVNASSAGILSSYVVGEMVKEAADFYNRFK